MPDMILTFKPEILFNENIPGLLEVSIGHALISDALVSGT
jgi:pyridoxine 5'-phosphate synthase PdxJ